jgi:S1-C subfamily serine protease
MAQYPTEQMHLIFAPKEDSRDLQDEVFHFFDGLFVGAPGGQVTVLAVEREGVSEQAGLKAGDVILAVGAYPTHGDLMTFSKAYADAKRDARDNEADTYSMTIRGADGTTRTAKISMPLRIKGGLMDGFTGKP